MKPIIAIIFGGVSAEHEVSLLSAIQVIEHIDHNQYDILQVGIDKDGTMYAGPQVLSVLKHNKDRAMLTKCTISTTHHFPGVLIMPENKPMVFQPVSLFFPLTHGAKGEDGTLQGVLEYSQVPYVGSQVLGSALGMDKIAMKKLFATYRLPQVPFLPFTKREISNDIISVREDIVANLHFPVFVKPANLGSSIGIRKATTTGELEDALEHAIRLSDRIIVEQGLIDMRELECAVLGDHTLTVSTVGEVVSGNELADYQLNHENSHLQVIIPALIDKVTQQEVQALAKQAFQLLNLRGMATIDFFMTHNQLMINKVSTIPEFTAAGMFARLFAAADIDMKELIQKLITISLETS
ncbi:D-alanine--D-alanine ligase [Candidatus Gracilibacteria bacterium]|jgi:D-alanine-D-alanine ligase|nr:D-alanine--D-alanine ligase [Candidatus Gracilibacteria bacterium]